MRVLCVCAGGGRVVWVCVCVSVWERRGVCVFAWSLLTSQQSCDVPNQKYVSQCCAVVPASMAGLFTYVEQVSRIIERMCAEALEKERGIKLTEDARDDV
jgi:hypothetical protein